MEVIYTICTILKLFPHPFLICGPQKLLSYAACKLLVVHVNEPYLILHIYPALYYSMAMYYLYMHLHIFFLLQQKPHIQNPLVATLQPL